MIIMALGLFRRQKVEPPADAPSLILEPGSQLPSAPGPAVIVFDGLAADQRVIGEIVFAGRLSDALNRRDPLPIHGVRVAPIDDDSVFVSDPTYVSVDPYGFELVVLGTDSLPRFDAEQQIARKIRKAGHAVEINLPPYRVTGTIWLDVGATVETLLGRITKLYLPVTGARVMLGDRLVDLRGSNDVLINLFGLRGIQETTE
jgi:hypothetical protein